MLARSKHWQTPHSLQALAKLRTRLEQARTTWILHDQATWASRFEVPFFYKCCPIAVFCPWKISTLHDFFAYTRRQRRCSMWQKNQILSEILWSSLRAFIHLVVHVCVHMRRILPSLYLNLVIFITYICTSFHCMCMNTCTGFFRVSYWILRPSSLCHDNDLGTLSNTSDYTCPNIETFIAILRW